jgi:hypothetical protein
MDTIDIVCKNLFCLQVTNGRPLTAEYGICDWLPTSEEEAFLDNVSDILISAEEDIRCVFPEDDEALSVLAQVRYSIIYLNLHFLLNSSKYYYRLLYCGIYHCVQLTYFKARMGGGRAPLMKRFNIDISIYVVNI